MPKKTSVRKNLRRVILNLHQYTAGKSIEEIAYKYNLDPKKVIKLGSNENVLGPSPIAIKAARKEIANVNIYPQVTSDTLVKKIKNIYKLKNTEVFIGNGMDHVFEMLARLFLDKGDETIICPPTFSCYELATLWAGAKPRFIPLKTPDYSLDIPKILKAINKKTKMIFLCSPNNPTGNSLQLNEIKKIIEQTGVLRKSLG
jgi:histidinol-phosphate aminotransferase